MDENNQIFLSSNEVLCSEVTEDITALNAKFIICSFETNRNNVKINRATIDNWLYTLVSQPVVGKLGVSDNGEADFTSHNMHVVTRVDERGKTYNDYEFDSSACGVFTSVQIEKVNGKEYITATAKLWKRFPEFCAIVKKRLMNGTLNTSWEISTLKSHIEFEHGKQIKVIDEGKFLGHSLLASFIPPAYPESQLLEVASQEDNELIEALNKDFIEISNKETQEEDGFLENTEILNPEVANQSVDSEVSQVTETIVNIDTPDSSALTEFDLRKALREAIADNLKIEKWDFYIIYHFPADGIIWVQLYNAASELDVIQFTYTVESDVVTVSEPVNAKLTVSVASINSTIAQKDDALITANEKIQELSAEVASLKPFKEACETAERERIESETAQKRVDLKTKIEKSKLFSEDEIKSTEISNLIETVDEVAIKNLMADKFMASLENTTKPTVDTSEARPATATTPVTPKANIDNSDPSTGFSITELLSAYSHKK
ncbi:MAG: hypothetical protein RSF40_01840 [Oscillospiraceae bacterium]